MAQDVQIKININTSDATQNIGSLNKVIKSLGADFVKLDTQAKFDKLRKEISEAKKTVDALKQANVTSTKEFQKSVDAVNDLEAAYAELSKTNTDLNATFEDVAGEIQPLSARLGEVEDRLYELSLAGQQNSKEFQDLVAQAGRYRQTMIQTDMAVDSAALTMTQKLGGALEGVTAGFAVAQGAMGLFGTESEDVEKALLKVQSALAILQGIQSIKESLPALKGLRDSIAGLVAPLLAQATATEGATLATRGLGIAMKALPIFAIIGAVTAAVSAFSSFNSKNKEAEEAEKKRKAAMEAAAKAQKEETEAIASQSGEFVGLIYQLKATNENSKERKDLIDQINSTYGLTLKNLSDETAFQEQLNATVDEYIKLQSVKFKISKNQELINKALEKQYNLEKLIKEQEAEIQALATSKNISFGEAAKDLSLTSTELYKNRDALEAVNQRLEGYGLNILRLKGVQNELTDGGKRYEEQTEKTTTSVKKNTDAEKEKQKAIEEAKRKQEEYTAALTAYFDALEQNRQDRLVDEERELQDAANKYDTLTALADKAGQDTSAITEEYQKEVVAINEKWRKVREAAELDKTNKEKKSNAELLVLQEQLLMQQEINALSSTEDTEEKREEIRKKYADRILDAQIKQIESERDILLTNTELTETERKEIIAKAELDIANLREKTLDDELEQQRERNKELADSYREVSDSIVGAVEAALTGTFEEINDAFATLNESLFGDEGLFIKLQEGSISAMEAIAIGIETVTGVLSAVFDAQEEKALEASTERFENTSEKYDELLANRLVSQEQYDAAIKRAEDKKAEEEKQARLKAFKQNKALAIVNAIVSTAQAVIAAFTAGASMGPAGVIMGPVMAGIAGALGAVQIGIIASQQFKAARGGIVPGSGPSTIDSVDAKLAPGETVINAQSSSMFPALLSEINQIGGGISLAPEPMENMTGGGGTIFEPQGGPVRAYVVEQDMTDSQRRVRRMENAGTFG